MQKITGKIINQRYLAGGDINKVYLLECEKGKFIKKFNDQVPADFFEKEAAGLELLRDNGLRVPEVFGVGGDFLLLEYLVPGKRDESLAGQQLALLHLIRQENYGLEYDNYIGSLKQANGIFPNWSDFFLKRRIYPQLELYFKDKYNYDREFWIKFSNWVIRNVFPDFSSLLHGDLWSRNLHYSIKGPIFIDPAVYRGHYMVDLAFSELFGGFSPTFYSAYNDINPITKIYSELRDLYQIYPLLVHANLFGGEYYYSALNRAKKYIN